MLLQLSISQCGGRIYSLYVDADRYVPVWLDKGIDYRLSEDDKVASKHVAVR